MACVVKGSIPAPSEKELIGENENPSCAAWGNNCHNFAKYWLQSLWICNTSYQVFLEPKLLFFIPLNYFINFIVGYSKAYRWSNKLEHWPLQINSKRWKVPSSYSWSWKLKSLEKKFRLFVIFKLLNVFWALIPKKSHKYGHQTSVLRPFVLSMNYYGIGLMW